jgi:hypothetical protein
MIGKVGRRVFTLPICLRDPRGTGYPCSDAQVHQYFNPFMRDGNDLDIGVHIRMVSFIAAAHTVMLDELRKFQKTTSDGEELLAKWHGEMEGEGQNSDFRRLFFDEVILKADNLRKEVLEQKNRDQIASATAVVGGYELMRLLQQLQSGWDIWRTSPTRDGKGYLTWGEKEAEQDNRGGAKDFATHLYTIHAAKATANLTQFIESLGLVGVNRTVCLTTFDESHKLGICYWILMRVLNAQRADIPMWYVFVGTRTGYQLYHPPPTEGEDGICD